jgi:hypothetical protein
MSKLEALNQILEASGLTLNDLLAVVAETPEGKQSIQRANQANTAEQKAQERAERNLPYTEQARNHKALDTLLMAWVENDWTDEKLREELAELAPILSRNFPPCAYAVTIVKTEETTTVTAKPYQEKDPLTEVAKTLPEAKTSAEPIKVVWMNVEVDGVWTRERIEGIGKSPALASKPIWIAMRELGFPVDISTEPGKCPVHKDTCDGHTGMPSGISWTERLNRIMIPAYIKGTSQQRSQLKALDIEIQHLGQPGAQPIELTARFDELIARTDQVANSGNTSN